VEQDNESWWCLADGTRKSPEELADLPTSSCSFDARPADLGCSPLLAVLDTSNVWTGLHHQLSQGWPPSSISTARDAASRRELVVNVVFRWIPRSTARLAGLGRWSFLIAGIWR
jgi:hypothetical protein